MTYGEGSLWSLCAMGMLCHTVGCLGRAEMTGPGTLAPSSPEDGRLGGVPW